VRGTIRLDGFASLHADWPGGEAASVPVRLDGTHLVLNLSTSAAGTVKVGFQDPAGSPVPGCTLEDCDELFGDDIVREVTWRGDADIARLKGQTVRLCFKATDAEVYSVACQE
jgi:hypothetical protein